MTSGFIRCGTFRLRFPSKISRRVHKCRRQKFLPGGTPTPINARLSPPATTTSYQFLPQNSANIFSNSTAKTSPLTAAFNVPTRDNWPLPMSTAEFVMPETSITFNPQARREKLQGDLTHWQPV
jgi:hypothetical protein